jgi:uncharacterized protein (DUF2267 family)
MSAPGLGVSDKRFNPPTPWARELMAETRPDMAETRPDRQIAWHVVGAVLQAVRDRITPERAQRHSSRVPGLVAPCEPGAGLRRPSARCRARCWPSGWRSSRPTQVEVERAITLSDDVAAGGRA